MLLPYANLQIKHQNKEASMPLTLPVHVVCNTSDEQIYGNIRRNSHKYDKNWIKCEDEHNGVAVIVGSAPSLLDTIEDIRALQRNGGTVFAMNNAAAVLNSNGIFPDYQVLIDARPQTAELVGLAAEYLFASQVHPDCFAKVPSVRLWHLQIGDIENEFPEYEEAYALIGGAASVGNTSTCLAYAMGYRDLQIFGMDSCHRDGKGHAKHQSINDGDPCAVVVYNGKQYTASLTMKLQAEKFQETAKALIDCGAKITLHGDGLLQEMWSNPQDMSEEDKYTLMWSQPEYRQCSPAERVVPFYLTNFKPSGTVLDFGTGCGRAALIMHKAGLDVTLLDFAENSRDDAAMSLPFFKQDLTQPIHHRADNGFCCDVMEHIPTCDVGTVIKNIMTSAGKVFFQISTVSDTMGAIIGQELHLTVRTHSWWRELFISLGYAVTWEEEQPIAALFMVEKL